MACLEVQKYFSEDVRSKKEIGFLALKQGSLIVAEYATKFKELVKFCPYYNVLLLRCLNCQIYDEDCRAYSAHYKSLIEKKGKGQFRGKSYVTPTDKGKHKSIIEKKPSGGGAFTSVQCYRCDVIDHHVNECSSAEKKCYKCGKTRHLIADCKSNGVTCYNYGEQGHISTNC
ncbi:uncharacterized protein LOC127137941 [Lathyrus oleraceus]|uniref:uncharacterized protein LOC127137941 n=1 Tax=Pisum sativum TaxID=3888 RepID=UPI0021D15BEA|nr:uncharacterized protein LOC127137941 [Pisum sativum]